MSGCSSWRSLVTARDADFVDICVQLWQGTLIIDDFLLLMRARSAAVGLFHVK